MQGTLQKTKQAATDSSSHHQSCLFRPVVVDQVATLAENYCCSFSQAEAVEVPILPLCFHMLRCSLVLQDFLEDVSFHCRSVLLELLHQRCLFTFVFSFSMLSSSNTLFLAVPGAAFIRIGPVHLGGGTLLLGGVSSFRYAILTLCCNCDPGVVRNRITLWQRALDNIRSIRRSSKHTANIGKRHGSHHIISHTSFAQPRLLKWSTEHRGGQVQKSLQAQKSAQNSTHQIQAEISSRSKELTKSKPSSMSKEQVSLTCVFAFEFNVGEFREHTVERPRSKFALHFMLEDQASL